MSNRLNKYWVAIIAFMLVCLISGGIVLAIKLSSQRPVEINPISTEHPNYQLEVYIEGAIVNPGFYPAKEDDSINALIEAAGFREDADTSRLKIYVPKKNEANSQQKAQKINLNRAEAWLLNALPGIGESKAQAIVEYRNKFGPFLSINDLAKVTGISKSTIDNIRNFITVED